MKISYLFKAEWLYEKASALKLPSWVVVKKQTKNYDNNRNWVLLNTSASSTSKFYPLRTVMLEIARLVEPTVCEGFFFSSAKYFNFLTFKFYLKML